MKKSVGIAAPNTKLRRDIDKKKRYQKARLQPLEVGGRVKEEGLVKQEQNVYKILKKRDEDGLVYAVQEESNPYAWERVLYRKKSTVMSRVPELWKH